MCRPKNQEESGVVRVVNFRGVSGGRCDRYNFDSQEAEGSNYFLFIIDSKTSNPIQISIHIHSDRRLHIQRYFSEDSGFTIIDGRGRLYQDGPIFPKSYVKKYRARELL